MSKIPYVKYRRPNAHQSCSESGRRFLLRRSALQWFLSRSDRPDAFAVDVPSGMNTDRADIGLVWMDRRRIQRKNILVPGRTCVVVCALSREECYAASINPDALSNERIALTKRMERLEARIRKEEPELRDCHSLFEEYAYWDYGRTRNEEYLSCSARLKEVNETLFRGTKMERLQQSRVANVHYLAIHEGTVFVEEVMKSWGVLTISPDGKVSVARKAPVVDALPHAQEHFSNEVAVCASAYVRAGMGLRV